MREVRSEYPARWRDVVSGTPANPKVSIMVITYNHEHYIRQAIDLYFIQLKGHDAVGLHAMVISEVEKPLLESALEHSGYNQTKTAKVLGLSRSTLRKKLDQYGLS